MTRKNMLNVVVVVVWPVDLCKWETSRQLWLLLYSQTLSHKIFRVDGEQFALTTNTNQVIAEV